MCTLNITDLSLIGNNSSDANICKLYAKFCTNFEYKWLSTVTLFFLDASGMCNCLMMSSESCTPSSTITAKLNNAWEVKQNNKYLTTQ